MSEFGFAVSAVVLHLGTCKWMRWKAFLCGQLTILLDQQDPQIGDLPSSKGLGMDCRTHMLAACLATASQRAALSRGRILSTTVCDRQVGKGPAILPNGRNSSNFRESTWASGCAFGSLPLRCPTPGGGSS